MKIVAKNGSTAGIRGVSLVDHKIRVALGLTCDEYVAANFVYWCVKKKKFPISVSRDPELLWKHTGMRPHDIIPLLESLKEKGLVSKGEQGIQLSKEWFQEIEKPDDAEFEKFWEAYGKVGNKKEARNRFTLALKITTYDHLIKQHQKYATYLEENPWRAKMACSVFLNPNNERWNDEYEVKGTGFEM